MNSNTYRRYFAGLLDTQARWLNRMSQQGLRLVKTGMLSFTFAPCEPGAYTYCVEYVGHLSQRKAENYKAFLEEMGYRVFFKNLNLNYAVGKVYLRPWAEKGALVGTSGTTLNKELLIVEKPDDGLPFQLHTTYEDKIRYLKHLRSPWLWMEPLFLFFTLWGKQAAFCIPAALLLIPVGFYQIEILRLRKQAETKEW